MKQKHRDRTVDHTLPKKNSAAKNILKKVWYFIWHDNSIWSWLVNILLAFLIIRFIIYPGIGLAMGTSLPIVAVVSSSMEHHGVWQQNPAYCENNYCVQEEWYLEKNITPTTFSSFSFTKGFNKGDIMIIVGRKPNEIKVGNVIVFQAGKNYPIIHRVVAIHKNETTGKYVYETKGDNNPAQIILPDLNEQNVNEAQLEGVATARIPYLGYIKIATANLITGIRGIFS